MTSKQIIILSLAAIAIAGFAVYANSLGGEFIFDDLILVMDNTRIKDLSNAGKLFTESIAAGYRATKGLSYRPIQMLSYMADYALYGLGPKGFHFTSILFHILAALALYALVRAITGDNFIALLTGMLFVTHPIHTEAVSYVSGRADPLSAFFMLTAFFLYVKCAQKRNIALFLLTLVTYACALLSRESALILPALILIYHFSFRKKVPLPEFFSVMALAASHIIFRGVFISPMLDHMAVKATVIQRIPGVFSALASYARLLVFPVRQSMEYGNRIFAPFDPAVLAGAGIAVIAAVYLALARRKRGVVFFSVSWFFIALLPQLNIYPVGAYMAEHWLYIPSIGFFLAVSVMFRSLWGREKRRLIAAVMIITMLSAYSYVTIKQNAYWKDALTFYERTIKGGGATARVLSDSAVAYLKAGNVEEAIVRLKRALELEPLYTGVAINLGKAYYLLGRVEEAVAYYKRAIELSPWIALSYSNLGVVYMDMGKKAEAEAAYKKALEIDPFYADAMHNLAYLYLQDGRIEEATKLFEKAIALNPELWQAHMNLAVIYYEQGRYDQAIARCDSAERLGAKIDPALLEALKPYRK